MSSIGISFGGLASGLDTNAIISALLAVEQRPISLLEQKKTDFNKQKSLYGDLSSKLEELAKKAEGLKKNKTFLDFKTTQDSEDYFTSSASSSAATGTYDIEVTKLASAMTSHSSGVADPTVQDIAGGELTFTVDGEAHVVLIDNNSSLRDVAAKINEAGFGVNASVVDTGVGTSPHQLVLSSAEPGADTAFSVVASGTSPGSTLDNLATSIEANRSGGTNAELIFNGVTIERSTNSIDDLVTGVTINLQKANTAGEKTRLEVGTDATATAEKIKEFVEAYNGVVDFMEAQSKVDEDGNAGSPLFGDSTLRSIRTSLRGILGGALNQTITGNSAYQMLSQVGIDADTDGRLTFTQSEFEEALLDDDQAVKKLFTTETSGFADRLFTQIDAYTDSIDGLIKARTDGIEGRIRDTDNRIDAAERRLEQYETQLTTRFANLESLLANLQGQGAALAGFSA